MDNFQPGTGRDTLPKKEAIVCDKVSFAYKVPGNKPNPVLQEVSLNVSEGEILTVVGPSGCGKTTFLKVICGLLPASSGSVEVKGLSPQEALERRVFGMVFQDPVLLPWRTVIENICLPFEIFNKQIPHGEVDRLMDIANISRYRDSFPAQLSGGTKSRVAIVRALGYKPDILLMDEPFGDLDEVNRTRLCYEVLSLWASTKCTIVLVTHNVSEAVFLGHRVVVLEAGHIPTTRCIIPVPIETRDPSTYSNPTYLETRKRVLQTLPWDAKS